MNSFLKTAKDQVADWTTNNCNFYFSPDYFLSRHRQVYWNPLITSYCNQNGGYVGTTINIVSQYVYNYSLNNLCSELDSVFGLCHSLHATKWNNRLADVLLLNTRWRNASFQWDNTDPLSGWPIILMADWHFEKWEDGWLDKFFFISNVMYALPCAPYSSWSWLALSTPAKGLWTRFVQIDLQLHCLHVLVQLISVPAVSNQHVQRHFSWPVSQIEAIIHFFKVSFKHTVCVLCFILAKAHFPTFSPLQS